MQLTGYHAESEKLKILIFGHKEFSHLMTSVCPKYAHIAKFRVHDVIIGGLSEIQQQIDEFAPDVIISAGANGSFLQSALAIPVVSLKITESDIISAITKAAKVSSDVCFIHFGDASPLVPLLQTHLQISIDEHIYDTPDQAREIFQIQKQRTDTVFVGASLICGLAAQAEIDSFLLYSQPSCEAAIQRAIELGQQHRVSKIDGALTHWLVERAKTPIVMLSQCGDSVTLNRAAKQELQLTNNFESELALFAALNDQNATDGECTVNGVKWWYHQERVEIDREVMCVYQLYPKQPAVAATSKSSKLTRLVYNSKPMHQVLAHVSAFASTPSSTLIHGESGTGKELIAKAIHSNSDYADGEFVALNCSAIPSELFEGELYGYRDGAFTGSRRGGKAGLVESANGGVLFLDEISELALDQQAKLLRFIQEKSYRPIGGTREIAVDLKLVAATNKDLKALVAKGQFREDLYYRLNVFYLKIPALRERKDDMIFIAEHIIHQLARDYHITYEPPAILDILAGPFSDYHWPGNVRELENIIERVLVHLHQFDELSDLQKQLRQIAPELFETDTTGLNGGALKHAENSLLLDALARFDGDKKRTAEFLGLSQTTLWRRLKHLNQNNH